MPLTEQSKSTSPVARAKVLVVDDMETNRKLLGYVLKPTEFQLVEASHGMQAVEILQDTEIDLVLLDVMMPGIDGFETCRLIREKLQLTLLPVLMLTSLGSSEDVAKSVAAGASGYFTKPFNSNELVTRVKTEIQRKRLMEQVQGAETALFSMARMLGMRDGYTSDHGDRLAYMAVAFGQTLGLEVDDLNALHHAGLLHDIGKLGVSEAILSKTAPLNADEWRIMQQHTLIGEVLCGSLRPLQSTAVLARCHHERWNGSGYPDGLKGEAIPLLARVFQIVAIFTALSCDRPYRPALPLEKVIEIMTQETNAGYWDPELMTKFLALLRTQAPLLQRPDAHPQNESMRIIAAIQQAAIKKQGVHA